MGRLPAAALLVPGAAEFPVALLFVLLFRSEDCLDLLPDGVALSHSVDPQLGLLMGQFPGA